MADIADGRHECACLPPILTTEQAAEMVGLDRGWFDRARAGGYGPPFMRVTSRIIRYDRDEVLAWFREHHTTVS